MEFADCYLETVRRLWRSRGISGDPPSAPMRGFGHPMIVEDFERHLTTALDKGADAARSALRRWATTGKAPRLSGVGGWMLSESLRWVAKRLPPDTADSKVAFAAGPPWSEETAKRLAFAIVDGWHDTEGAQWQAEEARRLFREGERWGWY